MKVYVVGHCESFGLQDLIACSRFTSVEFRFFGSGLVCCNSKLQCYKSSQQATQDPKAKEPKTQSRSLSPFSTICVICGCSLRISQQIPAIPDNSKQYRESCTVKLLERLWGVVMRSGVKFYCFVLIAIVTLLRTAPLAAQQNSIGVQVGATQQIPGAARVTPGRPAALSFEQAIQLAIENNLATLLAHERRNEARGVKQQSLAALLPNVSGVTYQASLTENLAALGFQPGIIPGFNSTFVGPFRNFDARVLLAQTIFDLSAIRNYQAGRAGVRVAELQEGLAREQVASGTGLIYLEALRADRVGRCRAS